MTADEALQRVRAIHAESGMTLGDNVLVQPSFVRTGGWIFFGTRKKTWVVRTDAARRGGNRIFEFDAESGELLSDVVTPR